MDNISSLLQEAKPLYFVRKKRNNRLKAFCSIVFCAGILGLFSAQQQSYVPYGENWLFDDTYLSDTSSVIEDMGFPVDEYGLLKVG